MDNDVTAPESIAFTNSTTKRREWWGWLGSMVWLFFMMYGHDPFIFPQFHYGEGSWYPFFFMVVFAVAIIAFGLRFGKDPNGLSRVASCTAPVALIITALFALLPAPLGSVLYAVSPVFMAPALTRRVFGILHTAGK
ncbi:MAG: hypothetical protein FWF69_00320, partial [Firmicutes bacterium]|nr:hypothetical protein [Bacillota bacterium]